MPVDQFASPSGGEKTEPHTQAIRFGIGALAEGVSPRIRVCLDGLGNLRVVVLQRLTGAGR